MEEDIVNQVEIKVNIQQDSQGNYVWTYAGTGVQSETGNFMLPGAGRTQIKYVLDEDCTATYQLLTVNLDPEICATHEIEHIHVHHHQNAVTIIDRNECGNTNMTPFSLRLVARLTSDITSGFLSPDPQVTNNPNSQPGGGGPKPK